MMARSPLRAGVAALVAALALGGCDQAMRGALGSLDLAGNVAAVQPQLIGDERLDVVIPAREARARLGPVARTGDVTVWQTLDGITLSMQRDVLIGTRGLGQDLMSADAEGVLALLQAGADADPVPHFRTHLDGEDQTVFRSYYCFRDAEQPDAGLRRIEIRCTAPHNTFTNTFWLDASGVIMLSRQWISPTQQYMNVRHIRG
jgi:hypothetical protein